MKATSAVRHGIIDWCFLEFKHLISGTFAKSFICYFEFAERHLSFEIYTHWLWRHLLKWIYPERCVGLNNVWTPQKRWHHLLTYSTYLVEPSLRVCGKCCSLHVTKLWQEIRGKTCCRSPDYLALLHEKIRIWRRNLFGKLTNTEHTKNTSHSSVTMQSECHK